MNKRRTGWLATILLLVLGGCGIADDTESLTGEPGKGELVGQQLNGDPVEDAIKEINEFFDRQLKKFEAMKNTPIYKQVVKQAARARDSAIQKVKYLGRIYKGSYAQTFINMLVKSTKNVLNLIFEGLSRLNGLLQIFFWEPGMEMMTPSGFGPTSADLQIPEDCDLGAPTFRTCLILRVALPPEG